MVSALWNEGWREMVREVVVGALRDDRRWAGWEGGSALKLFANALIYRSNMGGDRQLLLHCGYSTTTDNDTLEDYVQDRNESAQRMYH